jgi:opacity protein-like surface antigen
VSLGDIVFVYNFPTTQGKLTIGGGYSQSHDYNRALSGHGFNGITTITDSYASLPQDDPLNQAAYNAYAIDDVVDADGNYIKSKSIFRFLPAGESYRGINQHFNLTERGVLGEFSAFIATELVKNLMVGASIGVISGSYAYKRPFLEIDAENNYDSDNFIDSNDDGTYDTDIDQILSKDKINDSFTGFSARLGVVYQVSPHFNIGVGYQFKNVLHIDDKYGTHIKTTMDNGVVFRNKELGEYKYKVVRPARLNVGITAKNDAGFTISASEQYVAYSNAHIKFNELSSASAQNGINNYIADNLNDVFNLRLGLAYKVSDAFTPRISYAYYPSPTESPDSKASFQSFRWIPRSVFGVGRKGRHFYSAGFSADLSGGVVFNAAAQLGMWDDRDALYYSPPANGTEVVDEKVKHWNIMGGFRFYF